MFDKKLGFGFLRLPLKDADNPASIDLDALQRMVDVFMERGFCYFETAYAYHGGASETAIREALVKRYPREKFVLCDKMPIGAVKSKEEQGKIFNEQLRRCGVDYFNVYHIHWLCAEYYKVAQKFDTFNFILNKKKEGKVKHIGFSYHDNAELLDKILTEHPWTEFVQLQINYIDWDSDVIQSRKCYEVARKHGKKIIVMKPVKGGILAKLPKKAEEIFKKHSDMSVASWAVRYAASLNGVEMVLSSPSNMEWVLDITGYMQDFAPLTDNERAVIKDVVDVMKDGTDMTIPCPACQYCVDDCPKNIPIPKYFALFNDRQNSPTMPFYTQIYYDNYTKNYGKASECINCGKCARNCPQHLDIPKLLKDVVAGFDRLYHRDSRGLLHPF